MTRIDEHTRALITGGSRGLGRALSLALARKGATVVAVARGQGDLQQLEAEGGGRIHALVADVGSDDASALAARAIALAGGPFDLLVHDASTLGPVPMPPLSELSDDALLRVFQVNTLGPQRLTRALLGPMRTLGRGTIVGISSDAAVEAYPTWGAYGASKAALDHLHRVLRAELEGSGIRVFAIDPGEMDTAMHAAALPDADRTQLADPAEIARRILDTLQAGTEDLRWTA